MGTIKSRYNVFFLVFIVLVAMVCLPISVAHATVQNIAVTKLIDDADHKKTFFVITTDENTYHIAVEANITTVGNETFVDLSATLFNPLNETVTASARLPDTLYDAPYYNGPVEAFDLNIPKIVVDALKVVLPVVIIVALVIQVFHIIEDIIESTLKAALEELLNLLVFGGPFVYASLPWVLLKLIGDTNPDGTVDLFIPIPWQSWQLAQLYFGFILHGYYYFATRFSWWKVEEHDVHAPWPFSWIVLFSYYDATWIRSRVTSQRPDIPPSASFYWTPTQPTVGENITFVSTSFDPDGCITAYQWWLGDGNQITGASNFTYVYPVSGVYNVTLEVTDNGTLASNVTNTISVQETATARLVVIPNHLQTSIQKGQNGNLDFVVSETLNQSNLENVTFQAFDLKSFDNQTISSGNVSFNTNGITVASGSYANITAMLQAPTNSAVDWYYGNITVLSDNGGNGTVFVDVYVFDPPIANFTWSPLFPKVGEQVTFDASLSTSTAGPIEDYEWNFGDGGTASGSIVTHTFTNATIFAVALNVTDSKGLWNTTQEQVHVIRDDVAIEGVVPDSDWVYRGSLCHAGVNVTVRNLGEVPENFTVTLYAFNDTATPANLTGGTQQVTDLLPNGTLLLRFIWNSSDAQPCHWYNMTAVASTVQGETNTENNVNSSLILVKVRLFADVNGDGKVDMADVALAAKAFGESKDGARWLPWGPYVDMDSNGRIDMKDIALIAKNFGKTC